MRKVLLFAVLVVGPLAVWSTAATQRVGLEIGLPNGSTANLAVSNGSMVPVDVPQAGRFGFRPTIDPIAPQWVTVRVFILKGEDRSELGQTNVFIGDKAAASGTSPSFQIRVTRIE